MFLKLIADEYSCLLSVSENLSKDDFLYIETLKRAVFRILEIMGEATKEIPGFIIITNAECLSLGPGCPSYTLATLANEFGTKSLAVINDEFDSR